MVDGSRVLVSGFASSACWVGARGRPTGFGSGGIHSRGWVEIVATVGGGSGWTSYLAAALGRPISCGPGRERVAVAFGVGSVVEEKGFVVEAVVVVCYGW